MATCKICERKELTPRDTSGICASCRATLGIIQMPPPRRGAIPCRRCNGMKFVRVIPREYSATGGDYVNEQVAPMTATQVVLVTERVLLGGNKVSSPSIVRDGAGLLEMYICAGCGFVEWYCHDPQTIPIDPAYMTEYIDYGQQGPYR